MVSGYVADLTVVLEVPSDAIDCDDTSGGSSLDEYSLDDDEDSDMLDDLEVDTEIVQGT